jgi:molecular chaperone IbpA
MGYHINLAFKGDTKMVTSNALSIFDNLNQLTPYAVGFDRVFDQLNTHARNNATSTGFPPYNIRKGGDYTYAIEMALAGFSKNDIEIEVAEGLLTVRSSRRTMKPMKNMIPKFIVESHIVSSIGNSLLQMTL